MKQKIILLLCICFLGISLHAQQADRLPIAYVNIDSLLVSYKYATEKNTLLAEKVGKQKLNLSNRKDVFEKQVAEFQRKLNNNEFPTQESAESEYKRIQDLQTVLEKEKDKIQEEFQIEEKEITRLILDSIRKDLQEYNKTAGYEIILTNTGADNILYAKDIYNITEEVLVYLNNRYQSK